MRRRRSNSRPAWTPPVVRARRALRSCQRCIEEVRKILRVSDRFGAARPIRAHRHFLRAGTWLVKASDHFGRAVDNLKIATTSLRAAPWEGAGAPAALLETTQRLIDVSLTLSALSERLTHTSERLLEAAKRFGHGTPPPRPPRPMPPREFLIHRPTVILCGEMPRPPPATPADAPRNVSRGRAPPFLSICLSIHAVSKERRQSMSADTVPGTSHPQAAQALIESIRGMRATIPNFVIPASRTETSRLNRAASVSADFIEAVIAAVNNNPVLVRASADADPETLRDLFSFAEAYDPVADELEALVKFLRHSTKAARNRAGTQALVTYAVTRRLAKVPATAELIPVHDALQRALGSKRTKAPTTTNTPPTPEPPANAS